MEGYKKRKSTNKNNTNVTKGNKKTKTTKLTNDNQQINNNDDNDDDDEDQQEEQHNKSTTSKNLLGIDPSSMNYFKAQHYGAKGIRADIKRSLETGSVKIIPTDAQRFYHQEIKNNPHFDMNKYLTKSLLSDLLMYGLTGNNILIYGVGEKETLLTYYMDHYLDGEDLIELHGNPAEANDNMMGTTDVYLGNYHKNMLGLLDTIVDDYLHQKELKIYGQGGHLCEYAKVITGKNKSLACVYVCVGFSLYEFLIFLIFL